jgi:hypothetical protein
VPGQRVAEQTDHTSSRTKSGLLSCRSPDFFDLGPLTPEMVYSSGYQCAGCGEWNETSVDSSAGSKQSYIEDCQVCCKPNILQISWDMSASEYIIQAELE